MNDNNEKKNKGLIWFCAIIFGAVGVYLTFFRGNVSEYDSQTSAYRIDPNEHSDSESTTYFPTYYYTVDGSNYKCETVGGSSKYPSAKNNTVYYNSAKPWECKTEYEKSTSTFAGVICLVVSLIIIYVFIIRKPSENAINYQEEPVDLEKQREMEEKAFVIFNKAQLIYKRIVLGIIIAILLLFTVLDSFIFKQTITARNYIDTTATYVGIKDEEQSNVFEDRIYTFEDKEGKNQEIIFSTGKDEATDQEIKIKYDENNPQEYYTDGQVFDKSGMIWYIVKLVALVLLVMLFFNKKLLSKIGISIGNSKSD